MDSLRCRHTRKGALGLLNLGKFEEDSNSVAHFATLHVIFYFHIVLDKLDVAGMQESE